MKHAHPINPIWIGLFLAILLASGLALSPVTVWAGITPTPTSPATNTPVPTNTPTSGGGGGGGGGGSQPTATPVPPASPTPTQAVPATLPETGDPDSAVSVVVVALAGAAILFLVRAGFKQTSKRSLN